MPEDPTDKLGEIPAGKAALLTPGAYADIVDAIKASKPIEGRGIKCRNTDDGIVVELDDQVAGPYPFQVVIGSDDGLVRVVDGTFGDKTPTIGGVPINDTEEPPDLDCAEGDSVYFRFEITPYATNQGTEEAPDWVCNGGHLDNVTIVATSDATFEDVANAKVNQESGEVVSGVYYRRITTWTGAPLSTQPIHNSVDLSICGGGTSETDAGYSVANVVLGGIN